MTWHKIMHITLDQPRPQDFLESLTSPVTRLTLGFFKFQWGLSSNTFIIRLSHTNVGSFYNNETTTSFSGYFTYMVRERSTLSLKCEKTLARRIIKDSAFDKKLMDKYKQKFIFIHGCYAHDQSQPRSQFVSSLFNQTYQSQTIRLLNHPLKSPAIFFIQMFTVSSKTKKGSGIFKR